MRLVTTVFLLCLSMPVAAADLQVIEETVAPKIIGLEGADLYRARHVLRRFFAKERHPECYRVLFGDFQGNLRVDFYPKDLDPIVYNEGDEPPAVEAPCGRNVGYVLDRRGAIIRRIYSR